MRSSGPLEGQGSIHHGQLDRRVERPELTPFVPSLFIPPFHMTAADRPLQTQDGGHGQDRRGVYSPGRRHEQRQPQLRLLLVSKHDG